VQFRKDGTTLRSVISLIILRKK